jgi:hypothetical protein
MTGAPRDAYAGPDFVIVRMSAVRALNGSWEAAGCFQRIAWRCERDGHWRATMQEIADEIGVSSRTAKRITTMLREVGWVTSEREKSYESTLTWRIVWEDESAKLALSGDQSANVASSESANVALPSFETVETDSLRSSDAKRSRAKRKTKMTADFVVTDAMKAWYAQQVAEGKIVGIDARYETEQYVDYWIHRGEERADWEAGWRTWLRKAGSPTGRRNGNGRASNRHHAPRTPEMVARDNELKAAWEGNA